MNLTHPNEIFKYGASPSMVTLWLLCPHKWWLHYVAKQGRKEREAQRDSGVAFHNFLKAYYDPKNGDKKFEDYVEQFKKDFPEDESTEQREQAHLLAILKAYMERYPRATEPFEVIATEQKLNVDVPDCVLPLNCVIDLAIERYGGLWLIDHKTSNRLGSTYFDQFRNHWQTYTYIYATGKQYGRKCEGILYNALGMKKKIDADSFLRCDFAKTEGQMKFHINRWATIVNQMYAFVIKNWGDPGAFIASTTPGSCKAYNVNCPFLDYCEFCQNEKMLPEG